MTETLAYRQQPSSSFHDRPPSARSTTGSQRSTSNHYKLSSQSSVTGLSPRGSHRSSQRPPSNQQHVFQKPAKRLKSQYPLGDPEPHAEYILVASFDIDRGPIMEHQYPGAISPDENMLAELMLPDQTHMRQQDWTMFFLHKDAGNSEEEAAEKLARRKARQRRKATREAAAAQGLEFEEDVSEDDEDEQEEDDDESLNESPPLMYVLNLVNTKLDSSVKRGSIVKAMAICTRHSFLHIYKPLLLLALEDYMKTPTPDTLELLWNSLNAMDVSMVPRFSRHERHILQASDAKDMFVEKFEHMIAQRQDDEFTGKVARQPDSPTKSGPSQYAVPRDTHEFESKIVYNGIPIPVKIPTALSPETVGDFSLVKLIQTFGDPHRTQPQPFALHPHLTTSGAFTHPIVVLINAILTQKRVIFLGHNRPSGEVAEAVVAACALGSGGVLRGFTRHAFPYTDLTKIDELLKVPGFIAGVTNPAFSYHPEWWDLMCDLPSGRMKISSSIESAPITEGTTYFQQQSHSLLSSLQKDQHAGDPTGDVHFMEDINRGISTRCGETIIRAKFRAYITKATRIAAAFEETVYGASNLTVIPPAEVDKGDNTSSSQSDQSSRPMSLRTLGRNVRGHGYVWPSEEAKTRELAASAARIEGWRNTRSYYIFISDLASHTKDPLLPSTPVSLSDILSARPMKAYLDIYHSLSKLRTLRLTPTEAGAIYLALDAYCTDYDSILELLELTPMSEAGLFHLSLGLWHEDVRVRESVVNLLDRIRNHPAGRVFFRRLGGWANTGFTMCMQEKEVRAKAQGDEAEDMLAPVSINGRYS